METSKTVKQGERKYMSNIMLNHVSSPVVHKRESRIIDGRQDTTTTKCGIPLPTQILKSTLKQSDCEVCNGSK